MDNASRYALTPASEVVTIILGVHEKFYHHSEGPGYRAPPEGL